MMRGEGGGGVLWIGPVVLPYSCTYKINTHQIIKIK